MNRCILCGQEIKDETARFGPDCQKRYDDALEMVGTSEKEIGALFLLNDPVVSGWLGKVSIALIRGLKSSGKKRFTCYRDAGRFIEQARDAAGYITELPCPDCLGQGVVSEFQQVEEGACYFADVECECRKASEPVDSNWCESCFSSECDHLLQRAA